MRSFARRAGLSTELSLLASRGGALFFVLLFAITLSAQPPKSIPARGDQGARVSQVSFKGNGQTMQVEIQTSTPIVPESQSIPSPDRIIVDFPGAVPAAQLRSMQLNYGPLKAIRTGLFSANPPITRVVLDLAEPQPYQIVTSENVVTLTFRLSSVAAQPSTPPPATGSGSASANTASGSAPTTPAVPPPPPVNVSFQQGLLQIHAKRATLAEVLFEVQKQTGAEIPIPSGAEQEIVAADLGPASPRDVLAALLAGSRYNFVFIDNERDHSLQKAILSLR